MAVVRCVGGSRAAEKIDRSSLSGDCQKAAQAHPEGILQCKWGCLGLGSCVAACKLEAVFINSYGAAEINPAKCSGCGRCARACPKNLIDLILPESVIFPRCASLASGAATGKDCRTGCIACGLCEKNCPVGAIAVVNNHAVIDENRCIACGICAVKCPRGTILDSEGIFTPAP